jgi:hypothetical protein
MRIRAGEFADSRAFCPRKRRAFLFKPLHLTLASRPEILLSGEPVATGKLLAKLACIPRFMSAGGQ